MRKMTWCAVLAVGLGCAGLPSQSAAGDIGCCKIRCEEDGRVSVMVIQATRLECEAYEPPCAVQWTAAQCEPPAGEPGFELRTE